MEIDRQAILEIFLVESEEHLQEMEKALVDFETRPEDRELIEVIFRHIHTLKGDSSLLGFEYLMDFTHILENFLNGIRKQTILVTSEIISLLLETVDVLREIISQTLAGNEQIKEAHKILLQRLTQQMPVKDSEIQELISVEENQEPTNYKEASKNPRTIRVDIEKLEKLLTLTGEITIARGRLRQSLDDIPIEFSSKALEANMDIDSLFIELQTLVMKARMIPLRDLFQSYIRSLRDLAKDHSKQIKLIIEGEDVEVDTSIVQHLRAPLTHMIRNAVDHAIELPEVRSGRGKKPAGAIILRAFRDSGNIVIQIIDDGVGINKQKVLERAKELGYVEENEQLTDRQIYQLIFKSGFSTAKHATKLSGRGVGMDVVRRSIEFLRGSISVDSQLNEGTCFTLRLPLTLAIIEGFLVGIEEEVYIIPLDTVVECLELPLEESQKKDFQGVMNLRGDAIAYVRLNKLLDLNNGNHKTSTRESIIVVQYSGKRAGLVVDRLYGENQVVVKSLGKLFEELSIVSGATILGNGKIALILDIPSILRIVIENNTREIAIS
ncbi:MAG: chemotaxis protein CheA [Acidobacteria bacterium]|nr:chemotaxis protein CheA [Acidobacteriota bacterium]